MKRKFKKGYIVVIIGRYKGARGVVLGVDYERQRVLVEAVGELLRHTKPSTIHPEGGIFLKQIRVYIDLT